MDVYGRLEGLRPDAGLGDEQLRPDGDLIWISQSVCLLNAWPLLRIAVVLGCDLRKRLTTFHDVGMRLGGSPCAIIWDQGIGGGKRRRGIGSDAAVIIDDCRWQGLGTDELSGLLRRDWLYRQRHRRPLGGPVLPEDLSLLCCDRNPRLS